MAIYVMLVVKVVAFEILKVTSNAFSPFTIACITTGVLVRLQSISIDLFVMEIVGGDLPIN